MPRPDSRRIGVDFDNTIVSYDGAFHAAAVERGLIAAEVGSTKEAVRDWLRAAGREDDWTELQGHVYGPGMAKVRPFAGVADFFGRCIGAGVDVFVVSHKTLHPYRGPRHDLHASARGWLEAHGFTDPGRIGLPAERVFFETTKQAKLDRIARLGCTHFVDDLPEFLLEPGFPAGVERVLFDPHQSEACRAAAERHGLARVRSWAEAAALLLP
jgi:hypothetical protein